MATINSNPGKSLNERINDVMNAKVADRSKKRTLLKLGLRAHEIDFIFAEYAKAQPGEFDFGKITFGIEIECANCRTSLFMNAATRKGLAVIDHTHQYFGCHTDVPQYKLVPDGSLSGYETAECVTPVLNGESGLNSLKALCDVLGEIGATVNRSCGLHVHIGAAAMSDEHYCRIFKNYKAIETAIDTFMPLSRRDNNNTYCSSLKGFDFSRCTTKQSVRDCMNSRYFKVNAEAYSRHRTIEFRQHSGTIDYKKISMWVKFLAKLVEYSYKHQCPTCTRIEEIPFIDDEMKEYLTARRTALN